MILACTFFFTHTLTHMQWKMGHLWCIKSNHGFLHAVLKFLWNSFDYSPGKKSLLHFSSSLWGLSFQKISTSDDSVLSRIYIIFASYAPIQLSTLFFFYYFPYRWKSLYYQRIFLPRSMFHAFIASSRTRTTINSLYHVGFKAWGESLCPWSSRPFLLSWFSQYQSWKYFINKNRTFACIFVIPDDVIVDEIWF